jgi:hypothetical protein
LPNFLTGFVIGVGSLFAAMAAAAAPVPAELAGTTWRWVHFASSAEDFAVAEPKRYTLAFDGIGWITLRADCNRGAGGAARLLTISTSANADNFIRAALWRRAAPTTLNCLDPPLRRSSRCDNPYTPV